MKKLIVKYRNKSNKYLWKKDKKAFDLKNN